MTPSGVRTVPRRTIDIPAVEAVAAESDRSGALDIGGAVAVSEQEKPASASDTATTPTLKLRCVGTGFSDQWTWTSPPTMGVAFRWTRAGSMSRQLTRPGRKKNTWVTSSRGSPAPAPLSITPKTPVSPIAVVSVWRVMIPLMIAMLPATWRQSRSRGNISLTIRFLTCAVPREVPSWFRCAVNEKVRSSPTTSVLPAPVALAVKAEAADTLVARATRSELDASGSEWSHDTSVRTMMHKGDARILPPQRDATIKESRDNSESIVGS